MPVDRRQQKCCICQKDFSLITRRHWCRSCLRTICRGCSSSDMKIIAKRHPDNTCVDCSVQISVAPLRKKSNASEITIGNNDKENENKLLLSSMQQFVVEQLAASSQVLCWKAALGSRIDIPRLKQIVISLSHHHPILRLGIDVDNMMLVEHSVGSFNFDITISDDQKSSWNALVQQMTIPFSDLSKSLFRVGIFRGHDSDSIIITFHAVLCDLKSVDIFIKDLCHGYTTNFNLNIKKKTSNSCEETLRTCEAQETTSPPDDYLFGDVFCQGDYTGTGVRIAGPKTHQNMETVSSHCSDIIYWKKFLSAENKNPSKSTVFTNITSLKLPGKRNSSGTYPSKRGSKCKSSPIVFSSKLVDTIASFSGENKISQETVLLATWIVLLRKYCNRRDVSIGFQQSPDTRPGLGMFDNIIPISPSGDTFDEICSSAESILSSIKTTDDHTPFYRILQKITSIEESANCGGGGDGSGFCRIGFQFFENSEIGYRVLPFTLSTPSSDNTLSFGAKPCQLLADDYVQSLFDMQLVCYTKNGTLQGSLVYCEAYDPVRVQDMCENYIHTLVKVLQNNEINNLEVVSTAQAASIQKVLSSVNQIPVKNTYTKITQLLEQAAEDFPEVTALLEGSIAVSFQKLNSQANQYARFTQSMLSGSGVGSLTGKRIAVLIPHGYFCTLTLVAILKAGGVCIPLDSNSPFSCVESVINNCRLHSIITSKRYPHVDELLSWNSSDNHQTKVLVQEVICDLLTSYDGCNLSNNNGDDDDDDDDHAALMSFPSFLQNSDLGGGQNIYNHATIVSHSSIINEVLWSCENRPIAAGVRILFNAKITSPVYPLLLWSCINSGGTLCVVDTEVESHAAVLGSYISHFGIERIFVSPSYLSDLSSVSRILNCRPSSLRDIIICGEGLRMSPAIVLFLQNAPFSSVYVDYYGGQQTIVSSIKLLGACETWRESDIASLGQPISGNYCKILDTDMQQVPKGVEGTLHCAGSCLCSETAAPIAQIVPNFSLHDVDALLPDWTGVKSAFKDGNKDPKSGSRQHSPLCLCHNQSSEHITSCEDVVTINDENHIQYLRKNPSQMQIFSFSSRISFHAFEVLLRSISAVEDCVAIQHEHHLAVVLKTRRHTTVSVEFIRDEITKLVTSELIPSFLFTIKKIPTTPTGDVDRKKVASYIAGEVEKIKIISSDRSRFLLQNIENASSASSSPSSSPTGKSRDVMIERIQPPPPMVLDSVKSICLTELNLTVIDVEKSIFYYGGSFLTAVTIVGRICSKLNCVISISEVLEHASVSGISLLVNIAQLKGKRPIPISPYASEPSAVSLSQAELYNRHCSMRHPGDLNKFIHAVIQLGVVDLKRLADCLYRIVSNHGMLRTTYHLRKDQSIYQKVTTPDSVCLNISELQCEDICSQSEEASSLLVSEASIPFELSEDCLVRIRLFHFKNSTIFQLVTHPICADDYSVAIIMRDLKCCYTTQAESSLLTSPKSTSAQHALPYVSYTQYEKRLLLLAGDHAKLNSGVGVIGKKSLSRSTMRSINKIISSDSVKSIQGIAKECAVTRTSVFLTLYIIVISVFESSDEVKMAFPFSNRCRVEFGSTVGCFSSTHSVVVTPSRSLSFRALCNSTFDSLSQGLYDQHFREDETDCEKCFVDLTQTPQKLSRNLLNFPNSTLRMKNVELNSLDITQNYHSRSRHGYTLSTSMTEGTNGELNIQITFDNEKYSVEEVSSLLDSYTQLISFTSQSREFSFDSSVGFILQRSESLLDENSTLKLRDWSQVHVSSNTNWTVTNALIQRLVTDSDSVVIYPRGVKSVQPITISGLMDSSSSISSYLSTIQNPGKKSVIYMTSAVDIVKTVFACLLSRISFSIVRTDLFDRKEVIKICEKLEINYLLVDDEDFDENDNNSVTSIVNIEKIKITDNVDHIEDTGDATDVVFFTINPSTGSIHQKFTNTDLHHYCTKISVDELNWNNCTKLALIGQTITPFELFGCITSGGGFYLCDSVLYKNGINDHRNLEIDIFKDISPTDIIIPSWYLIHLYQNDAIPKSVSVIWFSCDQNESSKICELVSKNQNICFKRITSCSGYECSGIPALQCDVHRYLNEIENKTTDNLPLGKPSEGITATIVGPSGEMIPLYASGQLFLSGGGVVTVSDVESQNFCYLNSTDDHLLSFCCDMTCSWNQKGYIFNHTQTDNNKQMITYRGVVVNLCDIVRNLKQNPKIIFASVTKHSHVNNGKSFEYLVAIVSLTESATGIELREFSKDHHVGCVVPDFFILTKSSRKPTLTNAVCNILPHIPVHDDDEICQPSDVDMFFKKFKSEEETFQYSSDIVSSQSILNPLLVVRFQPESLTEIKLLLLSRFWSSNLSSIQSPVLGIGCDSVSLRRIACHVASFFKVKFSPRDLLSASTLRKIASHVDLIRKTSPLVEIPVSSFSDRNPLSHIQMEYLSSEFTSKFESRVVYICSDVGFELDVLKVQSVMNDIISTQELLQVEFCDGFLQVSDDVNLKREIVVTSATTTDEDIQTSVKEYITTLKFYSDTVLHGTDLITSSVLDKKYLILACHPVFSDDEGLRTVLSSIISLLKSNDSISESVCKYTNFTFSQKSILESPIGDNAISYWTGLLFGSSSHLSFPWDWIREDQQIRNYNTESIVVNDCVVENLIKISSEFSTIPSVVLTAVVSSIFHLYTSQCDVMVGLWDNLRESYNDFNTLGNYTKILPMRIKFPFQGKDSLAGLLSTLSRQYSESVGYNFVPESEIIKTVHRHRTLLSNPLYDIVVSYRDLYDDHNIVDTNMPVGSLQNFSFTLERHNSKSVMKLRYDSSKVSNQNSIILLQHVCFWLRDLSVIRSQIIADVRVVGNSEPNKPVSPSHELNNNIQLRHLLLSSAEKFSDRIICKEIDHRTGNFTTVTFKSFFDEAISLASIIQNSDKTSVCIENSSAARFDVSHLLCVIAAILSGKTFVVQSGTESHKHWTTKSDDHLLINRDMIIGVEEHLKNNFDKNEFSSNNVFSINCYDGTSIYHTEDVIREHCEWFSSTFQIEQTDCLGFINQFLSEVAVGHSNSLILFVSNVLPFLLIGGSICCSDARLLSSNTQKTLQESYNFIISTSNITVIAGRYSSGLVDIADELGVRHLLVSTAPNLSIEKLKKTVVSSLFVLPECFGVVAANIGINKKENSNQIEDRDGVKFILGEATPLYSLLTINKFKQQTDFSVPGELLIKSKHFKWNSIHKKQKSSTRSKFSEWSNGRVYRTGILAQIINNKIIQIGSQEALTAKRRGHHIDCAHLQRIILHLNKDIISKAIVITKDDSVGERRLICYVQKSLNSLVNKDIINEIWLSQVGVISPHIQIDRIVVLEHLPISDVRRSLRLITSQSNPSNFRIKFIPPRSYVEHIICLAFAESLGNDVSISVSCGDTLFYCGGDMTTATRVIKMINSMLSLSVPLQLINLLENPTPKRLASYVERFSKQTNKEEGSKPSLKEIEMMKNDLNIDSFVENYSDELNSERRSDVLLTGATGFIASFVLNDLMVEMKRKDSTQRDVIIYCLVRARSVSDGVDRIRKSFSKYQLDSHLLNKLINVGTIVILLGNAEHPHLGISRCHWDQLCSDVSIVYHLVGNTFNYSSLSYSLLRLLSIEGMKTILSLVVQLRKKKIVFATHLAGGVIPSSHPEVIINSNCNGSSLPSGITTGGAMSDFVCENLLKKMNSLGIDVTIFRLNNVTGSALTGVTNVNNISERLLLAFLLMKSAPDLQTPCSLLPVDYCSKIIVGLSSEAVSSGKVYHLSGGSMQWNSVISHMHSKHHLLMHRIELSTWKSRLHDHFCSDSTSQALQRVVSPLFNISDDVFENSSSVVASQAQTDLLKIGKPIPVPRIDKVLISTYVSYYQSLRVLGRKY